MLDLFVYGSLKRGQQNFDRYCAGCIAAEPARIAGRLYRQADGYPMLVVPSQRAQALGTGDGAADVRTLAQVRARKTPTDVDPPDGDWQWIEGEVFRYDTDIAARLAQLDVLEDFRPGAMSLYHRVIVAVLAESGPTWVWTYIAPHGKLPAGAIRMGSAWP
ncbi:MAG: gamma-glutamylcyclotransferase [Planctomycetales bacterium]|nr:gamma-glutamylcyclotransferase [Planctomycetales bacterium]